MERSRKFHTGARPPLHGRGPYRAGFTLIELMIVVAIIGVIAAIAIPKFGELIAKSKESTAKGALGTFRSALDIYYVANQGLFPLNTNILLQGDYIDFLPKIQIPPWPSVGNPGHADSDSVENFAAQADIGTANEGLNIWGYVNAGPDLGHVAINCIHLDSKSTTWSDQ